ncbi:MAG: hypothetical protein R3F20_03210 [Planctomycetota bacterium]
MVMRSPLLAALAAALLVASLGAQTPPDESRSYRVDDLAIPPGIVLEVGGLLTRPDGSLMVCTRRGEVWRIVEPFGERPGFSRFAQGLSEPLGLLEREDGIYVTQRGELSRLRDRDGDGRCDAVDVICDDWSISGNYHEYLFGPCEDREGNLWVTANKPFGDEPFGRAPFRGWAYRITPEGVWQPVACGLRSPCGVATSPDGEIFYTDNQGEWCGASKLSHIAVGDFHGHPDGIDSCERPESLCPPPGFVAERDGGLLMPEVARRFPSFKLPAVWFPYDKMGQSPSGLAWDRTEGRFGPFAGQIFVGDQHHASVMRVALERVRGHWQGACFPFREGLSCGVIRVAFAADGSLVCGLSNRGWGSKGRTPWGVQRIVFTGETPFEIREMRVRSAGFRLEFTDEVDPESVRPEAFRMKSYTYRLHEPYGSPEVDGKTLKVDAARAVGPAAIEIDVKGLRRGYVHELAVSGLRDRKGRPLLHDKAYYTLIELP